MYRINDYVYNCYKELGKYRNISFEALEIRLNANIEFAPKRERIFENQNKWRYFIGNFYVKVDHDTNDIYFIGWLDTITPISTSSSRAMEQRYIEYGLNKKGNNKIA